MSRQKALTRRSSAGSIDTIGLRSNDSSRKRCPTPVPMPRLTAARMRCSRQRQGRVSLVCSSSSQVDPSHSPNGQRPLVFV